MTPVIQRRQALMALLGGSLAWVAEPGQAQAAKGTTVPDSWPAWHIFRAQFVSEGGRVIDTGSARSQTFSEGQAYALFFALVANDRNAFEILLRWTEDNLCGGDLTARLPAWLWGRRDDDSWGVIDSNAASDADLWLAYALGEAGRLWNERRYEALSKLVSARVLREEAAHLPGLGLCLLPGPVGFATVPGRWRLNPSYMPMQLMRWLVTHGRDSAWKQIADSSLKIIVGAAPRGFAPDWILYDAGQGFLPDFTGDEKGQGAYNAIRVYLWAGMLHPNASDRKVLLKALAPMAHHVRDKGQPPESIDIITGQATRPGPPGFSAAMLPFLQAQGDLSTLQLQLDRLEAKPLRADAYYEQALSLFAVGWREGFYKFAPDGRLLPKWKT
jgi:endo-1,4-beta-D-glucanase Y